MGCLFLVENFCNYDDGNCLGGGCDDDKFGIRYDASKLIATWSRATHPPDMD